MPDFFITSIDEVNSVEPRSICEIGAENIQICFGCDSGCQFTCYQICEDNCEATCSLGCSGSCEGTTQQTCKDCTGTCFLTSKTNVGGK